MNLVENLQKDIQPFLAEEAATAALLKRVLLFLEDSEFVQADIYCEKVLDAEPENPVAYLYKLIASRQISSLADLASAQCIINDDTAFKKAVRFAPEEMQTHLQQLNMQIYANSIEACLNRAKIHLAHGELKETAQQYQDAMKLWEDSREALPNAKKIHTDLANEISCFNWKLLLHNRQCPDDTQLIARSIPINNERLFLNAVKWADAEKKAYFESVARDTLFNAHLKCMGYIKTKQTRLAQIWANHYKAAAATDDCLANIHQALVDTDGFTKFSADAPAGMLQLIKHYKAAYPNGVEEIKAILKDYYVKIFQSLLDFTGKEPYVISEISRIDEDSYAVMIAQQEAKSCTPGLKITPVQENVSTSAPAIDPVWATEAAQRISAQMADSVSDDLSPYGVASTYLIAARELTIRYSNKDGIVTEPLLFHFICQYYANAIAHAQPEQASAIQTKFNDFLIETVHLPSASTEVVAEASNHMQGNPLPYQIYLTHITNNYSVKSEDLIPPEVIANMVKWRKALSDADPKRDCYWISDNQDAITSVFAAAKNAVDACRQYTSMLKKSLDAPYQQVLASSGEGCKELSDRWNTKMAALQSNCNKWADSLESQLSQVQELNYIKLAAAQKHIKTKETWQLILSIGMQLLFVFTVLVFAKTAFSALNSTWSLLDTSNEVPQQATFHIISILAPLVASVFSMVNALAAPSHDEKGRTKTLWLFILFSIFSYIFIHFDLYNMLLNFVSAEVTPRTDPSMLFILVPVAISRTLVEFFLCKLRNHTRSNTAKVSCRVGSITAKVVGLVQVLACLTVTALCVCCLMLTL